MSKKISPKFAKTFDKISKMVSDNYSTDDFWILNNGSSVDIVKQRSGEKSTQSIQIPRKDFIKMVNWYIRPQRVRSKH